MSIEIPKFDDVQNTEQPKDYFQLLHECYVDLSEEMIKPEILLSII